MKHVSDCRPCGGVRLPARPGPPGRPEPDEDRFLQPGLPRCPGGYLMQRILASGCLHRRRQCYPLCLRGLPEPLCPPLTVADAFVCAAPQWEETCCRDHTGLDFLVTVPLLLRLRDGAGRVSSAQSWLQENLRLCPRTPQRECWRGQVFVQAAVRLAGRAECREECCSVPLEVLIEGYLLAPCALNPCPDRNCPPPRPWYPQPRFDPFGAW